MNTPTSQIVAQLLFDYFWIIVTLLLLKYDLFAKWLTYFLLSLFFPAMLFGISIGVAGGFILYLDYPNDAFNTVFIYSFIAVLSICFLFFWRSIIKTLYESYLEIREDINGYRLNPSNEMTIEDLQKVVKVYFNKVDNGYKTDFLYGVGFFIYIVINWYGMVGDEAPQFLAFGLIQEYKIYDIQAWAVILAIIVSYLCSFLYYKYYLNLAHEKIYNKLNMCAAILAEKGYLLVMDKNYKVGIIDNNDEDDEFIISPILSFIKSNQEIYYLFKNDSSFANFKNARILISKTGENIFSDEFYKDFV